MEEITGTGPGPVTCWSKLYSHHGGGNTRAGSAGAALMFGLQDAAAAAAAGLHHHHHIHHQATHQPRGPSMPASMTAGLKEEPLTGQLARAWMPPPMPDHSK